jgi:hypothetical protein
MKFTKQDLEDLFEYRDGNLYWKRYPDYSNKSLVKAGFYHSTGYQVVKIYGKRHKVHRIIFMIHHGYVPKYIDHIDGNKLNNNIENLRECNHNQNMHNRRISSNNTSGIKGITWRSDIKKWWPQLMVNNKRIYLGTYDDLELAELVIIEARNLYHGKFAKHR